MRISELCKSVLVMMVLATWLGCHGTQSDDLTQELIDDCTPTDDCQCKVSPLVVDLDGDGFLFTAAEDGVVFEIKPGAGPSLVAWTQMGDDDGFVVYDINGFAIGRVVPYVLVGGGAAWTELTVGGLGLLSIENSGFAWQAGAGLNYQVSEDVAFGIGYRYAELPAVEIFGFELDGGGNHGLFATATVALN